MIWEEQTIMIELTEEIKRCAIDFWKRNDHLEKYDFKDRNLESIYNCVDYLTNASGKSISLENELYGNIVKFKVWKYWTDILPKEKRTTRNPIDCDKDPIVMQLFATLLSYHDKRVIGYNNRYIYFENENCVETETINSVEPILNCFFRYLVKKIWQTKWSDVYSNGMIVANGELVRETLPSKFLKDGAYDRDVWLILCLDEISRILIQENMTQELTELRLINDFCNFVHNWGNFCVLPFGANAKSPLAKGKCKYSRSIYGGQLIRDDIFTFIEHLKSDERYMQWKVEFDSYRTAECMDLYYETLPEIEGKTPEERYLKLRIQLINNRVQQLKSKLNSFLL